MSDEKVVRVKGNVKWRGSTITVFASADFSAKPGKKTLYPFALWLDIPKGGLYRVTSPSFEVSPSWIEGKWAGDFYLSPLSSNTVDKGEPVLVLTLFQEDLITKVERTLF